MKTKFIFLVGEAIPMFGATGISRLNLLWGGAVAGALLIFIIAKMIGS